MLSVMSHLRPQCAVCSLCSLAECVCVEWVYMDLNEGEGKTKRGGGMGVCMGKKPA